MKVKCEIQLAIQYLKWTVHKLPVKYNQQYVIKWRRLLIF